MRALSPLHRVVAVVVCLALPMLARVSGHATFAWAMFTGTDEYRLRIVARDSSSRAWFIAPTDLTRGAGQNAVIFFSGADHFRRVAGADIVRRHLREVALHACTVAMDAVEVEIAMQQRQGADAATTTSIARVRCR